MPRPPLPRLALYAALAVGLALRAAIVFGDEGIVWPDEVYQSFEPAHRLVFGYGLQAWEMIDGARSWAFPGLVALLLKLCAVFGGDSPFVYVRATKLAFALLSLGAALGVARLARAHGAKEEAAAAAAGLYALAAPVLYFSHRAMSENAAAAAVVWGLALLLDAKAERRQVWLGASLLGLAVLFRLHAGVFAAGTLAVLAARKDWARVKAAGLALAAWAAAFGLLDAATWHDAPGAKAWGLFHSAVVYLRFNLVEGKAAGWGTSPWSYYLLHLWTSSAPFALALLLGAALAARRALGLLAVALAFFALHSAVAHKELRFVVPALPLFAALVGVGLTALPELLARWAAVASRAGLAAVALAAAASAWSHRSLTMGEVGSYPERASASAWDDFGNVNRLLLEASRREDLCGLRIDAHTAWTGGATYLHRRAPIYMPGMPPQLRRFNYAIVGPGSGAEVVAEDRGLVLVRLPFVDCAPDPGYSWRLP